MSSERARRFAAGLVATEKRIGWGASVLGFWIQGVWARRARDKDEPLKSPPDTAEDFAEKVRDAIAAAIDRYEAEAWTAIADDPGSWPPENQKVELGWFFGGERPSSDQETGYCVRDDEEAGGAMWMFADSSCSGCDRPTHWRPLPAPPRGGV